LPALVKARKAMPTRSRIKKEEVKDEAEPEPEPQKKKREVRKKKTDTILE
jgi:hypothetical protein